MRSNLAVARAPHELTCTWLCLASAPVTEIFSSLLRQNKRTCMVSHTMCGRYWLHFHVIVPYFGHY